MPVDSFIVAQALFSLVLSFSDFCPRRYKFWLNLGGAVNRSRYPVLLLAQKRVGTRYQRSGSISCTCYDHIVRLKLMLSLIQGNSLEALGKDILLVLRFLLRASAELHRLRVNSAYVPVVVSRMRLQ